MKECKEKHIEIDVKKGKLLDKGLVGVSCREGGSTAGRKKLLEC